jgi:mandelate racemase
MATELIESVSTTVLALPLEQPRPGPYGMVASTTCLLVEVSTRAGLRGFSNLTWYNPRALRQIQAVKVLVDDLGELLAGRDALERAALYQQLRVATTEVLHEGIGTMAVGLLDIALWDVAAKHAGVPLAVFLGGKPGPVLAYASHKLGRADVGELIEEAGQLRAAGFAAAKASVGGRPVRADVERIRAIRETLGPDVRLLVDCGRKPTAAEALRLAQAIAEYDIYWMEDPVAQADIPGLRWVRERAGIAIATGERITGMAELNGILAADAADHLTLDIQRMGGISGWLPAADALRTRTIPLSSHGGHELQVQLLAAQPHGHYLEYHPWWDVLYVEPLRPRDGALHVPEGPGLGLELDRAAIERYRVS